MAIQPLVEGKRVLVDAVLLAEGRSRGIVGIPDYMRDPPTTHRLQVLHSQLYQPQYSTDGAYLATTAVHAQIDVVRRNLETLTGLLVRAQAELNELGAHLQAR